MTFDVDLTHKLNVMMTGSRQGVTEEQKVAWSSWLRRWSHIIREFRMGDCVGADTTITTVTQMHLMERHFRIGAQAHYHSFVAGELLRKFDVHFYPSSSGKWTPDAFWTGDSFVNSIDVATSQGMPRARRWLFVQRWLSASAVEKQNCQALLAQIADQARTQEISRSDFIASATSSLEWYGAHAFYDYLAIFLRAGNWIKEFKLPTIVVHPASTQTRAYWRGIENKDQFKELTKKMRTMDIPHPWNKYIDAAIDYPIQVRDIKEPKARDLDMIRESHVVCAFPKDVGYPKDSTRSGTWFTVRHALKSYHPTFIFYPDKSVEFFASYEAFLRKYPHAPKMTSA